MSKLDQPNGTGRYNQTYYSEKRGANSLTEVLYGKHQKHGGRVEFVLKKLIEKRILKEIDDDIYEIKDSDRKKISWLDVAAGTAPIARLINKNYSEIISVVSADINDEGLRLIGAAEQKNINFVKGNIFRMPFSDNTYEVVTAYDIIEHLENPDKAIIECVRVLKSSGLLLIVVPNPFTQFSLEGSSCTTYESDPTHIIPSIVSTDYFRKILPTFGLSEISVSTRGHAETESYFKEHNEELFKPEGGNHIYAWGWKK
jgi:ubiquinone/menaquinone biosynthesis C-methylase UbiE